MNHTHDAGAILSSATPAAVSVGLAATCPMTHARRSWRQGPHAFAARPPPPCVSLVAGLVGRPLVSQPWTAASASLAARSWPSLAHPPSAARAAAATTPPLALPQMTLAPVPVRLQLPTREQAQLLQRLRRRRRRAALPQAASKRTPRLLEALSRCARRAAQAGGGCACAAVCACFCFPAHACRFCARPPSAAAWASTRRWRWHGAHTPPQQPWWRLRLRKCGLLRWRT